VRYIETLVEADLKRQKMVFVGGPRQCGKTTLAKQVLRSEGGFSEYLNWDHDADRKRIVKMDFARSGLLAFDELHKFKRWKNWLKGLYDKNGDTLRMIVTGSARLDVYRRGGDSLLGRYHYWRLHPFCLAERPARMTGQEALLRLMRVGGFPEPFLDGDERFARRWRRERTDRVLKDDVRDLESVRDISTLTLFVDLLRARVGSSVVLANMAEDLQVAPKTLKAWLEVLERMYLVFSVKPYTDRLARAIQKPPKVYFYDNADVEGDEGAVFENLVATHLLKRIQFLEDRDGHRYELRYLRDKEGREVDFVVLKDRKVVELIEAKWGEPLVSKALQYYAERLLPKRAIQVIGRTDARQHHAAVGSCTVLGAAQLFTREWLHTEA
jgi:uncharacterized protein